MSKIFDDPNLTFGDIKSMLREISTGKIEAVEKVDGQNIFFTWDADSNQAKFARSKNDIAGGGLSRQDLLQKFSGHPAKDVFFDGSHAIVKGLAQLSSSILEEAFGIDGMRYINAEIVHSEHPNLIRYSGNYIVLHNMQDFSVAGDPTIFTSKDQPFRSIIDAISGIEAEISAKKWSIVGPIVVQLIKSDKAYNKLVSQIDEIKGSLSDDATLSDFAAEELRKKISPEVPIPVHKQEQLISLIVGDPNSPSLAEIKMGLSQEGKRIASSMGTQIAAAKILSAVLSPIDAAIVDFTVKMLQGMSSYFSIAGGEEIARVQKDLGSAIEAIKKATDLHAAARNEIFITQMQKLKSIERFSSSLEGIVFEHPPGSKRLWKLTGSFAAANQILGLTKYGSGSIPPLKIQEAAGRNRRLAALLFS